MTQQDNPNQWKQISVWAEESGVRVLAEPENRRVTLTIESPIGLNTITISRWRWERLVRGCTVKSKGDADEVESLESALWKAAEDIAILESRLAAKRKLDE